LTGVCSPAWGDALEERFETMWEALWTQTGLPVPVRRWPGEIRVRFTGAEVNAYRDDAWRALTDATQAAGIGLRDVSAAEGVADLANLEFQLVPEGNLPPADHMMCKSTLKSVQQSRIMHAVIEVRARRFAFCGYHEVMHAMGIPGHPTRGTVLAYFAPPVRDALTPVDVLILKGWYSPRLMTGASPFEALLVMTDTVVEAVEEPKRDDARKAQSRFLAKTLKEMERYALGEGEIPAIVLRSGWTTEKATSIAQTQMGYIVGVAHLRGIGAPANREQARLWFERGAEKGSQPAKIMLERVFKQAPSEATPRPPG
jgi:hypothetical protein